MTTELIADINQSLELEIVPTISMEELRTKLSVHINQLINHDFEKLVFYLYRIDVNEKKMRTLLDTREGEDAAGLIADLIIERQLQKIESRRQNSQQENKIPDEEKW